MAAKRRPTARSSPRSRSCGSATPSADRCASPRTATSSGPSSGRCAGPGSRWPTRPGSRPHPKVSYANAAPTGAASEAEYVEIGVVRRCDPEALRAELDAALPAGPGRPRGRRGPDAGPGRPAARPAGGGSRSLGRRPTSSRPRGSGSRTPETVPVQRMMKQGLRTIDLRPALVAGEVADAGPLGAVLEVTVANVTPTVRPDEILVALREIGGLATPDPGPLDPVGAGPADGRRAGR